MQSGAGKAALIVIGLGVIGDRRLSHLQGRLEEVPRRPQGLRWTGAHADRDDGLHRQGPVLAGAGILVIVATLRADPAKAAGIDAAVKTLGQAPFGRILLILAAVGFAAYGAYCFVLARFARM